MKRTLNDELYTRYPVIFAEHTLPSSAMSRGIECGDGWHTLIDTLCATLQDETDSDEAPQLIATQVKAKYGGLRFYVGAASQRQRAMISLAESLSRRTCEICGAPGKSIQGDWIRTRCDTHIADPSSHSQKCL